MSDDTARRIAYHDSVCFPNCGDDISTYPTPPNDWSPHDLTKRIARILNNEGWTFEGIHEPGEYDECEDCRRVVDPIAARIAREVAAEVRAAKAEALREAADAWHAEHKGTRPGPYNWMWDRATEYETGDTDEHR